MIEDVKSKGVVEIIVEDQAGNKLSHTYHNTVLQKGREALTSSIANDIGDAYDFYIDYMLFGNGGTTGGVPKLINTNRNGLFCGSPLASKSVVSVIDPSVPTQAIFTAVLTFDDPSFSVNEMALRMHNGDLYSMATFPDLAKTSSVQISFNWTISFV